MFEHFLSQHRMLTRMLVTISNMEKTMSALDDKVDAVQATLNKFATDNDKALADLKAAVANGVDPSAAIAKLDALNAQLQGMDAASIAADPASAPAPAPTPAP